MYLSSENWCIVGVKGWIFTHIDDNELLFTILGNLTGTEKHKFRCIIRNKEYLLMPSDLDIVGIRYTIIYQYPGDVVITYPGVIHGTVNLSVLNINACESLLLISIEHKMINVFPI